MTTNPVDIHDLQKVLSRMANRGSWTTNPLEPPDLDKQPTRLDRMKEYTNALSARGQQNTSPPKTARSSKTEPLGYIPPASKQAKSESVEMNCGPCMRDGIQQDATGFCIDCSEYFCEDCTKHHKNLKITKSHTVRNRKKMPKLKHPIIEDESMEACQLHVGEMIRYYCKEHDVSCCAVCATLKHRTCPELIYIPGMNIKKTKKNCKAMIKQIHNLIGQYRKVKEDTKKNASLLDLQKSDFQQAILKVHQDALDLLHKIEKEIVGDLSHVYDSEKGYLQGRMDTIDEVVSDLQQASTQLEMAQENNMDSKTFLQMKKVTKQVAQYETLVNDLSIKNTQPMKLTFKKDKQIKHFLKATEQLGSLVINERPDRHAIPISEIKVKSRSDALHVCDITGSTAMPDGRVVMADMYNSCLKLADTSYKMISQSKLSSEPWDVCSISDDQVIVSLPRERKLQFYAITGTMRPLKRIGHNESAKGSQYYGLAYHHNKLFVTCPKDEPPNVKILDMQGRQLHQISANHQEQNLFTDPLYITVKYDGKTIYVTDSGNFSIIAVEVNGHNPAKIFQIPENNPPGGIVALPDGNVVFCGYKTNTLEHLSTEMDGAVEVKGSDGLLNNPQSITYCGKERRLIVGLQKQDTLHVLQMF